MSRVLVVDDDRTVAEVVVAYLQRAGIDADHAADGHAALASAAGAPPDAVVLDLMLPGIDGLEVCRRLRRLRPDLPVLMLTARGEEEDRVLGLETGADDYVTKPFSARELTLRVQALLRRASGSGGASAPDRDAPDRDTVPARADGRDGVLASRGVPADVDRAAGAPAGYDAAAPGGEVLRDGDLVLDAGAHRVTRRGRELSLTAREFDLLRWFLRHPGQVHDRPGLMRDVWGWEFGDQSTVTVHVRRLREKVEDDPSRPERLVTVFGVGYRWDGGGDTRTDPGSTDTSGTDAPRPDPVPDGAARSTATGAPGAGTAEDAPREDSSWTT
ncbi:response regulator transcription factor [Myceligenerans pegani]|uniref:Response regulator transcription factor n=1 Tax=Myceligenerans pegani TaxID=2776917 RepID=A0ABR9N077_9MICO|nr:response regulator transcription factor [Myceligenerans sp. TRM 65318]MBE1877051.1 response regulator transcription factor [Myceligenerans sp. TRM 65318]MBE3019322.1 response regulator transcription factor [Myceligenerans sp. TRM 65318]